MKKMSFLFGATMICFMGAQTALAADAEKPESGSRSIDYYIPEFHGVIRSRWEMDLDADESRFQVRNARLSAAGKIAPCIDYLIQADFCDRGKVKILDAFGRFKIIDGLSFRAGQFLMPIGIDPIRAPADYIFSNESFMGKNMCSARGVGAEAVYSLPKIPLSIKASVYNPTSVSDHEQWHKTYAFAGTAAYCIDAVTLSAGIQSSRPEAIRMNIVDAAVTWDTGRLKVEGEYMNKHYTNDTYKSCNAWSVFADYNMPVKAGVFNRLFFSGRYDAMTDHSTGTAADDGRLITDDPARNRITVGSTLSYRHKSVHADIRLNYEKYFYHHGTDIATGNGDKILAELIIKF